jgi:hypothetical protein
MIQQAVAKKFVMSAALLVLPQFMTQLACKS